MASIVAVIRAMFVSRLEVDLLLGTFAEKHVGELDPEQLVQYEDVLNQETIDIFNYITMKQDVPSVSYAINFL